MEILTMLTLKIKGTGLNLTRDEAMGLTIGEAYDHLRHMNYALEREKQLANKKWGI